MALARTIAFALLTLQGPEPMNNRMPGSLKCLRPAVKIFVLGRGLIKVLVLLTFAQCSMNLFRTAKIGPGIG
jgi:hypothetical protein